MLKLYYKGPEYVNVLWNSEDNEPAEIEDDFLSIEWDPNIFDFNKIREGSTLYKILILLIGTIAENIGIVLQVIF